MNNPPSAPQPGPAQGAALSGRIEWIDVVKGLAIALVVYGHVMQGASASGAISSGALYRFSNAFVYSFHMPAFFFISGLLSTRSLRGPIGRYISDKAATIAWPYLVWTPLTLLVYALFSKYYNHPMTETPEHRLLTCLWDPGEAWFLHALFCIQIVMIIINWVPIEIVMGLSLVGFFLSGWTGIPAIEHPLFFLPFFAAGVWGGSRLDSVIKSLRWLFLGALGLFLFQAAMVASPVGNMLVCMLILGFTGTFGLIALSEASHGSTFAKVFARIGAASLGVFLLHPFVQGLTRAILQRALHLPPGISVAVQIIAAVLIPVFLYEQLMRGPGRFLFSLKKQRKKVAPPTS